MLEPRIIKSDDSAIPKLYSEGWELAAISDGKMYFHREKAKSIPGSDTKQKASPLNSSFVCQFGTKHALHETCQCWKTTAKDRFA